MARRKSEQSLRWLRDILRAEIEGEPGAMPTGDSPLFDSGQLKLYSGGIPEKGRRILIAILDHAPEMLESVNEAHFTGPVEAVLETVHELRGLAQVVGAYTSAQVCLRVELLYEAAEDWERHELIAELNASVEPLIEAMETYMDSWAA